MLNLRGMLVEALMSSTVPLATDLSCSPFHCTMASQSGCFASRLARGLFFRSIQRCFHVPAVPIQFFRVLTTWSDVLSTYRLDFRVGYCALVAWWCDYVGIYCFALVIWWCGDEVCVVLLREIRAVDQIKQMNQPQNNSFKWEAWLKQWKPAQQEGNINDRTAEGINPSTTDSCWGRIWHSFLCTYVLEFYVYSVLRICFEEYGYPFQCKVEYPSHWYTTRSEKVSTLEACTTKGIASWLKQLKPAQQGEINDQTAEGVNPLMTGEHEYHRVDHIQLSTIRISSK
jgi:hypothetical protein